MLTARETATVLAALLYWREEMCPHDRAIMRPYFAHFGLSRKKPLDAQEIEKLCDRLRTSLSESK